jgi:hypothetical protein
LEHFAQHEAIERKEAEKEAAFAGLSVEEVLESHEHDGEIPPPAQTRVPLHDDDIGSPVNPHPHDDQGERLAPKYTRVASPEKADPIAKYINAKKEGQAQGDWGEGTGGYKSPKNPSDKMRKNIPYKASRLIFPVSQ